MNLCDKSPCRRAAGVLPCISQHQSRAAAVWLCVVKARWRGLHRTASGQKMSLESFSGTVWSISSVCTVFLNGLSSWQNAQFNATYIFVWDCKSKNNGKCICCWSNSLPAEKDNERFYENVAAHCGYNVTCMSHHYLFLPISSRFSLCKHKTAQCHRLIAPGLSIRAWEKWICCPLFSMVPTEVVWFVYTVWSLCSHTQQISSGQTDDLSKWLSGQPPAPEKNVEK